MSRIATYYPDAAFPFLNSSNSSVQPKCSFSQDRAANDVDVLASVIVDTRRQLILRIGSTRDRIGRVKKGNFTYSPFGIAQRGFSRYAFESRTHWAKYEYS